MAIYKIVSVSANKCLNIYGSNITSLSNNQNVTLWSDSGSTEQKWSISSLGSGVYVRSQVNTNFGLNAYRSGTNWNCDVYPVSGNETDAAVTFEKSGSYYKIRLTNYSGRYLTAGGTGDGANVYWATATGANNQLWNMVTVPTSASGLRCPLDSYNSISQGYSSSHLGIDYAAAQYTPIKAAKAGKVIYMQNWTGGTSNWASMGHCVYIQHSDGMTIYMHMNEYPSSYVYVGKTVSKGDTIGRVGTSGNSTGYHLHFGYKRGTSFTYNSVNAYNEGTWANPLNYMA